MHYIVNRNAQINSGYHKVHTIDCNIGPRKENVVDLGECMCLVEAQAKAKDLYKHVNTCKYCCKDTSCEK